MKYFFGVKISIVFLFIFSNFLSAQSVKDTITGNQYYKKADSLSEKFKADNAVVYFKKALDIYQTTKSWEKVASCYNKIASNYRYTDNIDLDSSLLSAEKALKICESKFSDNHKEKANAINNIGWYHYEKGNYSEALLYFKKALRIRSQILKANHKDIADSYNCLGRTYSKTHELDLAINSYRKALKIAKHNKNEINENIGIYYNNIFVIYWKKGDYSKATESLYKAIDFQKKVFHHNHPKNVFCYNNLGNLFMSKGNFNKGLESYKTALRIQLNLENEEEKLTASLYNNIGNTYKILGKYDKALSYHKKALTIRRKIYGEQHNSTAMSFINLGNIFRIKENPEEALKYYHKAKEVFINTYNDKHPSLGRSYNNIAVVHFKNGDINKGIEYFNKSIEIYKNAYGELHPKISDIYANISECYLEKNIYDKSIFFSKKALNINFKILGESHPYNSEIYNNFATIAYRNKKYKEALEYCKKAINTNVIPPKKEKTTEFLDIKTALNSIQIKGKIHKALYKQKGKISNLQKAIKSYSEIDSLITYVRQTTQDYQDKLTFSKTVKEIYTESIETNYLLYQATKDPEALFRAFYYSEKSKANTLQELLQESNAKQFSGIPKETLELEHTLKTDHAFYTSQIAKQQSNTNIDSTKLALFENKIFGIRMQQDSLHTVLENTYPKYYHLKYNTTFLSVENVQKQLPDNATLLEFFTTDSITYAFTISRNTIDLTKTDTPKLQQDIEDFHKTIISKNVQPYKDLASKLYTTLFNPITSKITADELIIIPDGPLWHLNFDVLHTQKEVSNNPKHFPYLLRKHVISYANSANLLFTDTYSHHIPNKLKECLAFSFSGNKHQEAYAVQLAELRNRTDDLPGTRKEIRAIADIIDGKYFYGTQANEANFKENASQYSILHLALHGEVNNEHPENSKLYFTKSNDSLEDDQLYGHELFALTIPAELTVLSACNTGTGKIAKGEGIMSLGNAFQYAGTKSLLLSNWEISDQTTPELMKYFYANLKTGMNKAKALQQAKLKYLNTAHINYMHPFYWSGFYLVGNSDPITLSTNNTLYWIFGILTCCVILVLGVFLYRKRMNTIKVK